MYLVWVIFGRHDNHKANNDTTSKYTFVSKKQNKFHENTVVNIPAITVLNFMHYCNIGKKESSYKV